MSDLSSVTVVWSVISAAAFLLGLMQFTRWAADRRSSVDLTFSIVAFAFVAVAVAELHTMYAQSPSEWAALVKFIHLPMAVLIVGTVIFVRQYLRAGRVWLAGLVIMLRVLILAINAGSDVNVNFERVDSLARIEFLGETISTVGEAVTGRWQFLATISNLLLVAFILDATISLWKRAGGENRRRALVIGGGVFVFVGLAATNTQLVIFGIWNAPFLIAPCFTVTLLAMAYELSRDALHASQLARDLDESRRRLELTAESADLGLCEWDSGSGKVWATQRALEIFGIPREDGASPDRWLAQFHPDDVERVKQEMQATLEHDREFNAEFRICPRGQGTRWVAALGRSDHSLGGSRTRIRGVVRDVSEQRRTLDETQELRRELAHAGRVSVLGQLASSLAHELSQPLGAILRNAEAAEMLLNAPGPDIEELKAIVADIQRDDRRAGDVIDRLRSLLKRRQMDAQPIAADSMLNDVKALLRADAASRHVTIDWTVDPGLPTMFGDRVHLSQVLINLIINAMDAVTEQSLPERRITVHARHRPQGAVEIEVRDSGPGIPAEVMGRIFNPFFTTKAAGMGMGLSVCRTILDAHGGSLAAENARDGGAVFRVRLPGTGGSP